MNIDNNFIKKFKDDLTRDVNLSNYSWFNLGGNAEYFYKAKNKSLLLDFLKEAKLKKLKTTFLGAGSNILFRDSGVRGAVIKLGQDFSFCKIEEGDILTVGAATLDRKVANFAKENNSTCLDSKLLMVTHNAETLSTKQDWEDLCQVDLRCLVKN